MLLYNSKYFVINEDDYHYYSQIGGMTLGGKQAVKGIDSTKCGLLGSRTHNQMLTLVYSTSCAEYAGRTGRRRGPRLL